VPFGQFEHDADDPDEKVPIAHCKQYANPLLGEYDPMGHPKQEAEEVAPIVGLYVPAGHNVQDVAWLLLAYEP
jgi:hypothetical protein